MKRVLITGSRGFIGKVLVKKLKEASLEIVELDRSKGLDILDPNSFKSFRNIDIIFHLAAVVGYVNAIKNPEYTYKVNVNGTINVLNFCQREKAKLIFPSTFVYGPPFDKAKRETDLVSPTNIYTHSKFVTEQFCRSFAENLKTNVVIARTSNAFGPGQDEQYIIPLIIDIVRGKRTRLLNDPKAVRDFIYIDDLTDAYIALAKTKTKPGSIFNVCSGNAVNLKELVKMIKKYLGSNKKISYSASLRANEVTKNLMDNSKLRRITGWQPRIDIEEGLKMAIAGSKIIFDKL